MARAFFRLTFDLAGPIRVGAVVDFERRSTRWEGWEPVFLGLDVVGEAMAASNSARAGSSGAMRRRI